MTQPVTGPMSASGATDSSPTIAVRGGGRFRVRRIYCVGRNFLAHIREMKEADERDPPFFFQKPTDAVIEDGACMPYPPDTGDLQYEAELVAAIGRTARDVSAADAPDAVFGYAVGLDMTRRDRQRESAKKGLPWEIGKSFDASAPCGPIVPASVCGHPAANALDLSVNGVPRQHTTLDLMIWNVPEIISRLSQQYTLQPGDLIFTGTPDGVGPVVTGDRIEATVEGVGSVRISIG